MSSEWSAGWYRIVDDTEAHWIREVGSSACGKVRVFHASVLRGADGVPRCEACRIRRAMDAFGNTSPWALDDGIT